MLTFAINMDLKYAELNLQALFLEYCKAEESNFWIFQHGCI